MSLHHARDHLEPVDLLLEPPESLVDPRDLVCPLTNDLELRERLLNQGLVTPVVGGF